jgi:FKBP-type peptidyl-prolyl cis-trans isomerase
MITAFARTTPRISMSTTPSGLQIDDVKLGDGAEAQAGQSVTVHYTGWLLDENAPDKRGQKFDSSKDRDEPFEFDLGAGMVIRGWDEGVQGMKVGGQRILTIPPELGYGARGAGGVIPPNATLVFEVELLPQPVLAPLQMIDVAAGEGAEASAGRQVTVHYTGWLFDEGAPDNRGRKFDSSKDRNDPFRFQLGAGQVIRGWDDGVQGMKVGGTRVLVIPPHLGYGPRGAGGVIPPNATLVFEVALLGV